MHIEKKTINGLSVVFAKIPDCTSTTIEILVKAGSIYENESSNGLSHFLEHMFFKGGKKYKTPKDVAMALDTMGVGCNAFTGEEYAGYWVKCAPIFIHQSLEILGDMMVNPTFSADEIEKEKGVIIQEIRMYEDMPRHQVSDYRKEWYYGKNTMAKPILGSEENVLSFNQDDFFRHKHQLYTKDNLVIAVAGAIPNQQEIEEHIALLFGGLPEKSSYIKPSLIMDLPTDHKASRKKDTQQNHLIIGAQGFTMHDERRYAASLFMSIFGGSMSSRLFQEIREERGLCYYVGGAHYPGDITGTFMLYAGMEKGRRDAGLEAIYGETRNIMSGGITDQEYDQARTSIQGSIGMKIETSDDLAGYIAKQMLFKGDVVTIDQQLKKYLSCSKEEIESVGERLSDDNLYAYWIE